MTEPLQVMPFGAAPGPVPTSGGRPLHAGRAAAGQSDPHAVTDGQADLVRWAIAKLRPLADGFAQCMVGIGVVALLHALLPALRRLLPELVR